jgi:hypothetical protein
MQTIAFLLQEHVSIVRREKDLVKDGSKKVCNKVLQLNGKKKALLVALSLEKSLLFMLEGFNLSFVTTL